MDGPKLSYFLEIQSVWKVLNKKLEGLLGISSNYLFRFLKISRLFAIHADDVETDRSITNLTDILRHIIKIQLAHKKLFKKNNDS